MLVDVLKTQFTLDHKGFTSGTQLINKEMTEFQKGTGLAHRGVLTFRKGLGTAISSVLSLKGALVGLGLGFVTKSFVSAASEAENYGVRLKVLLVSQKEGNRLFKEMAEYAGRVPFEYKNVMNAATSLAGVMKGGTDEVKKWMPMIGDLAATTGLSIVDTTSQVIRMYSAGAASADMFRERGILAMMGFKAGVSYTAEETRKIMMQEWQKAGSQFGGATKELATTWDGLMSMFSDAWFQFRVAVMEAGVFDFMKAGVSVALEAIQNLKDEAKLGIWAQETSDFILASFYNIGVGIAYISDSFRGWKMIWEGLKEAFSVFALFVNIGFEKILASSMMVAKAIGADETAFSIAKSLKNAQMRTKFWNDTLFTSVENLQKLANEQSNVAKFKGVFEKITLAAKNFGKQIETNKKIKKETFEATYEWSKEEKAMLKELEKLNEEIHKEEKKRTAEKRKVWTDAIGDMTQSFIAGENMKKAVSEQTANFIANRTGKLANEMYEKSIDKIVALIGAHIGQGAAGSGAQGSMKGGVWGAIGEIALYLTAGVGAMLAGRGIANKFKATGGWMEQHPSGGRINQGSGIRDDVFLGATPGTRHWGMGGEFVVNRKSAFKHASLLEAINKNYDNGGYVDYKGEKIPWHPTADMLALGGLGSFGHGFYKGGIAGALAEMILFFATAVPSMFAGKALGNLFKSKGGWMDEGHGFGGFLGNIFNPVKELTKPFSKLEDMIRKHLIPEEIGRYIPSPSHMMNLMTDPDATWEMLKEMIRTPLEQVSRELVTPGIYVSNPLANIINTLKDVKGLYTGITGADVPFFAEGTPYVSKSGLAYVHQGERIVDAATNKRGIQPVHITIELEGEPIKKLIYEGTKGGEPIIHERGITNI